MYPDDPGAALPPEPMGGGFGNKMNIRLEGLIPLVLVVIIIIAIGARFDFWYIPVLSDILGGDDPMKLLIVGSPRGELVAYLEEYSDIVRYRIVKPSTMQRNPAEILAQYDAVWLDQTMDNDKSVPQEFAEEMQNYVKSGGKFVIIKNSGIYIKTNQGLAPDAVGWEAIFGDVVPVQCTPEATNIQSCVTPRNVRGVIFRQDWDNEIMKGIEFAPATHEVPPYNLEVFDVTPVGNEIAYIETTTGDYITGIVEKKGVFGGIIGKVIYFNYEPHKTPKILRNTLNYLSTGN